MEQSNLNLLFDLSATQPLKGAFHGGGVYAKEIFLSLVEKKHNLVISCLYDVGRELDEEIVKKCKTNDIELIPFEKISDIEAIFRKYNINKYFSALPYCFHSLKFGNVIFSFSVLGLRPIELPWDKFRIKYVVNYKDYIKSFLIGVFQKRYIAKRKNEFSKLFSAAKNYEVFTISNHSKFSLCYHFPELKGQIKVYYAPEKIISTQLTDNSLAAFAAEKNYILIVNSNRWIKNAYRAVKALDNLFSRFSVDFDVILIGSEVEFEVKNRKRFIYKGYVSDEMLEELYKNALFLLYPSLNEGFGYPPLEAMKYGTPVVASSIASIPEICGDAVLYFNPYSIDEISTRVIQMYSDENYRKEYSQRAIARHWEISQRQKKDLEKLVDDICSI